LNLKDYRLIAPKSMQRTAFYAYRIFIRRVGPPGEQIALFIPAVFGSLFPIHPAKAPRLQNR
jgi:hypothetical protein